MRNMSLTREQLLTHVHQPLQNIGQRTSPTKSTYRVRWREIREWADFVPEAQEYWGGLDDTEKNQVVRGTHTHYWDSLSHSLTSAMPDVRREGHLLFPFTLQYSVPHNDAIAGAHDDHARISASIPDVVIGQPDACFQHDDKIGGLIEIKTFWNLTNESIIEVIQGLPSVSKAPLMIDIAPLSGDHHGRLAVEQAYGYMFHNSVVYGLISTVNSFSFLARSTGGKLKVTQLIPATRTSPTVLQMLYYFSYLCASTPSLRETHIDGRQITLVHAPADSSTAPLIPLPSGPRTPRSSTPNLGPPRRSPRFQTNDEDVTLDIDITQKDMRFGWKGYIGKLGTGEKVFVKLWDSWKCSADEMKQEAAAYSMLRELWGKIMPRMLIHGGWGFCHTLVLEFIEVLIAHFIL